jgi:hypothetical protein
MQSQRIEIIILQRINSKQGIYKIKLFHNRFLTYKLHFLYYSLWQV